MSFKPAAALDGLQYVKGTPLDLAAGRGKKAFVVEFWATWCPPCRTTIPHLTEIAHQYKDTVEFVGITSENEEAKVSAFVQKQGDKMDYAVALDATNSVGNAYMGAYGVSGIPHAFVVNLEGNVSWHGHPADPEFKEALNKAIVPAGPQPTTAHRYSQEQVASMTNDDLRHLSAKDLRGIAQSHSIDVSACLEKDDYIDAIRSAIPSASL